MKILVFPISYTSKIDTNTIKGVQNYAPANTVRYNIDKTEHIKTVLGLADLSQFEVDSGDIVYSEPAE